MSLTREQILSNKSFRSKTIEIPEWGGEVRLKAMSGADREAMESVVYEDVGGKLQIKKGVSYMAEMLLRTWCDDDGNLLFKPDEINLIQEKDSVILARIFKVAAEVNGLSGDEEKVIEKNSEAV
jgi:hypothetical protein